MYSKTAANAREVGSSTRLCQAQIMRKQTKQAMEAKKGRYTYEYPHPSVTTDCVIFGFDGTRLNVLLVERGMSHLPRHGGKPGGDDHQPLTMMAWPDFLGYAELRQQYRQ